MSKNKVILAAGILLIAMPYLGFPESWKTIFYIIVGAGLIIIAVRSHLHRQSFRPTESVLTEANAEKNSPQ